MPYDSQDKQSKERENNPVKKSAESTAGGNKQGSLQRASQMGNPRDMLTLQQSIGNQAVMRQMAPPSGTVQRGIFGSLKKKLFGGGDKEKEEEDPEVSGPTDGRTMDESENGNARSMSSLIADYMDPEKRKLISADLVPNPQLRDKHQTFRIKAGGKFAMMKDGALTEYTYSFTDGNAHSVILVSQDTEEFRGKLGDGTIIAVKKDQVEGVSGYEKVDATAPLFPEGSPKPADVVQGALGDCYLMAAMSSIAQQNPSYFKEIMYDLGETVGVRLYEVDQSDQSNHTFTPKYFQVEKSIPKSDSGSDLYNRGALWVTMLEKAYAAGGFTGTGKDASATSTYEDIGGGFSRHAFEVLMGEKATSMSIRSGPFLRGDNYVDETQTGWRENTYWRNDTVVSLPWDKATIDQYDLIKAGPEPDNYAPLATLRTIFGEDNGKIDTWISFLKTDAIKDMFQKQIDEWKDGYAHEITLGSFEQLFKDKGLDNSVASVMMEWIKDSGMYPGELGSAVYSDRQMDMFNTIKDALANDQSVAINSHKYPSKVTDGTGHSGGEAKAGGMVGGHAYSVLAVKANTDSNPESDTGSGKFHWIQVRNPWGSYGREYDFSDAPENMAKAIEEGDGVFWLELSDLSRYFKSVDLSS